MADTKVCKKCGRELPISEFNKNKSKKDGLQSNCKECANQHRKQYYQENKKAIAEQRKQYRQENKKVITEHQKQYQKQYQKQWYAENKEHKKQYYQENKKAIAEYMKQWYAENKKVIAEQRKQYYNTLRGYCINIRNANIRCDRKYGRIGDELPSNYPTIEDYMELLQMPDFYDGKQYHFTEMGLDRIDNSKPHTLDNIVPCTTQHNIERQKMSFDIFKNKFLTI